MTATLKDLQAAPRPLPFTGRLTQDHVAVVIPARNEVRSLRAVAVRCLSQARFVIVVDDASTDGSLQAVADLPLIAIRSDARLGKGDRKRKCNIG